MNEIRIRATISPRFENYIMASPNLRSYFDSFNKIFDLANNLKHVLVVLLPNTILSCLSADPMLKDFIKRTKTANSNILFVSTKSNCNIVLETQTELFENRSVNDLISNCLKQENLPLLFDVDEFIFNKVNCDSYEENCKNMICRNNIELISTNINLSTIVTENLKICCNKNLNEWILKQDTITSDDIHRISILLAYMYNAQREDFLPLQNLHIIDGFINDIKKVSEMELKKIAFSIFRAVAYPSVNSSERKDMSIDWHPNNPSKMQDFQLFRIDVVELNKNGVKCSGKQRVLMAKRNNQTYILAYTSEHDFKIDIIKRRLNLINSRNGI